VKRLLCALALAGCAHSPGPLANRPHAALTLLPVAGLDSEEENLLEDALCQGLVEANGGDVSCPSSTRQVLDLERERALATGNFAAADKAAEQATQVGENVRAQVSREGEQWLLAVSYAESPEGKPLATQNISASSFDQLVERSTEAARSLLR
jgi:hypothetical protein